MAAYQSKQRKQIYGDDARLDGREEAEASASERRQTGTGRWAGTVGRPVRIASNATTATVTERSRATSASPLTLAVSGRAADRAALATLGGFRMAPALTRSSPSASTSQTVDSSDTFKARTPTRQTSGRGRQQDILNWSFTTSTEDTADPELANELHDAAFVRPYATDVRPSERETFGLVMPANPNVNQSTSAGPLGSNRDASARHLKAPFLDPSSASNQTRSDLEENLTGSMSTPETLDPDMLRQLEEDDISAFEGASTHSHEEIRSLPSEERSGRDLANSQDSDFSIINASSGSSINGHSTVRHERLTEKALQSVGDHSLSDIPDPAATGIEVRSPQAVERSTVPASCDRAEATVEDQDELILAEAPTAISAGFALLAEGDDRSSYRRTRQSRGARSRSTHRRHLSTRRKTVRSRTGTTTTASLSTAARWRRKASWGYQDSSAGWPRRAGHLPPAENELSPAPRGLLQQGLGMGLLQAVSRAFSVEHNFDLALHEFAARVPADSHGYAQKHRLDPLEEISFQMAELGERNPIKALVGDNPVETPPPITKVAKPSTSSGLSFGPASGMAGSLARRAKEQSKLEDTLTPLYYGRLISPATNAARRAVRSTSDVESDDSGLTWAHRFVSTSHGLLGSARVMPRSAGPSKEGLSPWRTISSVFVTTRLLRLSVLLVSIWLVPEFDSSSTIQHRLETGRRNETIRSLLLTRLIRWDSLYFLSIARHGYQYEQEHAFLPGITALQGALKLSYSGTALLACFLSMFFTWAAALVLYELTCKLHSRRIALVSAIIFAVWPAPALDAPYAEPLQALVSFSGSLLYEKRSWATEAFAAILWSLSGLTRSNGVFHAGFFIWRALHEPLLVSGHYKRALWLTMLPISVFAPFLLTQWHAYGTYCTHADRGLNRPWCGKGIIYSFVQSHYWNVGFGRYWTLQQLPNFVLPLPVFYLIGKEVMSQISADPRCFWTVGLVKSNASDRQSIARLPYVYLTIVTALLILSTAHVQIALRVFTSFPPLFWSAAKLVTSTSLPTSVSKSRTTPHWILVWLVVWGIISTLLWSGFYPPA